MIEYVAPLPPDTIIANVRDAEFRARKTAMPAPDLSYPTEDVTSLVWRYDEDPAPSAETVAAWQAAVADPTAPADAPWRMYDPTTIAEGIEQLATLIAIQSTATTLAGLKTDVNNKSAAIANALRRIASLMGA